MISITEKNLLRLFYICFSLLTVHVSSLEPRWIKVLSGSPLSECVFVKDRVYVTTDDRTISCISESGSFLWNRSLSGKSAPFLSASPTGTVYALSSPAKVMAYNADGNLLWQLSGNEMPVQKIIIGRDGRLFLIYSSIVRCITATGAPLWTLSIPFTPTGIFGETSSGDVVLFCANNMLLRITPFGSIREHTLLPASVTALAAAPGGYLASLRDGSTTFYDVRDNRSEGRKPSEAVWSQKTPSHVTSLVVISGTLISVHKDGTVKASNVTDGSVLWSRSTGRPIHGTVYISHDYNQVTLAWDSFVCAYTLSGVSLYQYDLSFGNGNPVISSSGSVYTTSDDWKLISYSVESRIFSEKKMLKTENYAILNGKSTDYALPFASDFTRVRDFFDSVTSMQNTGTIGLNEVNIARRLVEILRNDGGNTPLSRKFTPDEQARSAHLLGQLGSSEYRDVLLESVSSTTNPTLAVALLYGLGAFGYDVDGRTLESIEHLVRISGMQATEVQKAACDALYAIIRYESGSFAKKSIQMLVDFTKTPWPASVQEHARMRLTDILR